jgi:hypothetical protein
MAATTFSIKGTQTKTINPITITDVGGEVNQAGYIYVWLPSQFGSLAGSPPYAKWDSSQTTATIVDTGSGVVSPTVSYYAGNNSNVPNVVKLDITTPFSPGDSVTFSGLSIITYGQTTNQSYPLLWSVDGGYSYNTTDSNAIMSVDVTAPIFVGAYPKTGKVQANGSRKVSILTEINEDGAAYYVVVAHGAATPSVAQVIAGHNSADTAAIDAGNVAVTAYSARSFMTAVLGADATQYDVYVVGQDAAGNTTAATGITVTTPATTTYAVIAGTMTKESGDTTSTVNIDVTPVAAGGTVTLTIVPKDGMELKTGTLVATYNDGLQKTLILAGTGPYTFTMPAYAVTVTATFEAISCPSVFNASTYKAYPICGAATCNSGYVLSNGACVASGGSGGSIMLPVTPVAISLNGEIPDLAFTINNGAKVTTIPELNLNLNANPATVRGYIVSLDANFTNVGILAYPSTPAIFILPSKAGSYTLYLKYYSTTGVYSKLYTQSISFKPETTLPTYTPAPVDTTALITRYLFKRTLQLGSKGMDVKALQQFLNVNGYILSKNGAGSPGNETATFGPATKAALIKFQKTNKIFPAVGYFGPITIDAVNTK